HVGGGADVILCVAGLGPVLRTESGGDNKIALRAALRNGDVHLVGVMSNVDFDDLLASDHELLEFLTRINVEEPGADAAVEMLAQDSGAELEDEFGLRIEPGTIRRAVQLSVDYVLNERLPAKAIKILRRAAENIDYERKALAREMDSLDAAHVNDVVAEISGIPIETIAGTAGAVDYERELSRAVIGQEQAVEVGAGGLRGVKSGLPEPGKPAAGI